MSILIGGIGDGSTCQGDRRRGGWERHRPRWRSGIRGSQSLLPDFRLGITQRNSWEQERYKVLVLGMTVWQSCTSWEVRLTKSEQVDWPRSSRDYRGSGSAVDYDLKFPSVGDLLSSTRVDQPSTAADSIPRPTAVELDQPVSDISRWPVSLSRSELGGSQGEHVVAYMQIAYQRCTYAQQICQLC